MQVVEFSGQSGSFLVHGNVAQYELQYNSQMKLINSKLSSTIMLLTE